MSELNKPPYVPSAAELAELSVVDLSGNWLDMSVDYPSPRYLLEYKGVGFSPLGGIQAITGQKKNGKTFTITQLMAAIIGTGKERVEAKLPGLRACEETLEEIGTPPIVLYIDTEMEIENTMQVARRVHWLTGADQHKPHPQFKPLWLRAEESPQARWLKVRAAINEIRPTAIFLDGIRDVVQDFNDNAESAMMISQCMRIATNYDCCLWCVLHANPTTDAKNEKMRGHLGTELGNKASDTFSTVKTKHKDGTVTFEVFQRDARGKDVENWTFEVTDDAGDLGIPRICEPPADQQPPKDDLLTPDTVAVINSILSGGRSLNWKPLSKEIIEKTDYAKSKVGKIIRQAIENKLLEPFDDGGITKYRLDIKKADDYDPLG